MEQVDVTTDPREAVQAEEEEYKLQPIPTYMCGPVETRELPAKSGGYATYQNVAKTGVMILPFEPRRKSATVLANKDVWVGANQQSVMTGEAAAFLLIAGVALTVDHMDSVWIAPTLDQSGLPVPAAVSVQTSFWAD